MVLLAVCHQHRLAIIIIINNAINNSEHETLMAQALNSKATEAPETFWTIDCAAASDDIHKMKALQIWWCHIRIVVSFSILWGSNQGRRFNKRDDAMRCPMNLLLNFYRFMSNIVFELIINFDVHMSFHVKWRSLGTLGGLWGVHWTGQRNAFHFRGEEKRSRVDLSPLNEL